MQEINHAIKQTAASAVHGTELAQETGVVAQQSHEAVQKVVKSMASIDESSRRIGEIIHVVEAVAFQTNILALNAAVEAARAGEGDRKGLALQYAVRRSVEGGAVDAVLDLALGHAQRLRCGDAVGEQDGQGLTEGQHGLRR